MIEENLFPVRPQEKPLDLRQRANAFIQFVMDPNNGVLRTNDSGRQHFTAFLEGFGSELITYGAIVVGMHMRGEDVSALLPSLEDYYSEAFGVFLNGPGDTLCEYWYLMYVNALACEIVKRCLLHDPVGVARLRRAMERLIELGQAVNYDFNDQGYDFAANRPFTRNDAYRQPDAIGGYAYLMAAAFEVFGEEKYRGEARRALTSYQMFSSNPWYEIPSGAMAVLAASKWSLENREIDLDRIVRFALDPQEGCLHTGSWGDKEINGLLYGWRGYTREEAASRAYSLESMVALPFLAPLVKYHPRYAPVIGRYALHLAANLRWYFSDCLPADDQSRPDLTEAVPYESIRRNEQGRALYACGDFHGHKSVYGGALSLWLGEIIRPTEDEYVLRIDLNKTDFLATSCCPTFLYYNPHDEEREAALNLAEGKFDVYDVAAHRFVLREAQHQASLAVPARGTAVVALTPSGERIYEKDGILYAGDAPLDFHIKEQAENHVSL